VKHSITVKRMMLTAECAGKTEITWECVQSCYNYVCSVY